MDVSKICNIIVYKKRGHQKSRRLKPVFPKETHLQTNNKTSNGGVFLARGAFNASRNNGRLQQPNRRTKLKFNKKVLDKDQELISFGLDPAARTAKVVAHIRHEALIFFHNLECNSFFENIE